MFIYNNNKQLVNEFKKILIDENIQLVEVANKLDILPQQLNNKFNNKRIAFTDLQTFLDTVGYDLVIDFKKRISETMERDNQ